LEFDEPSAPASREGGVGEEKSPARISSTSERVVALVEREVDRRAPSELRRRLVVAMVVVAISVSAATALHVIADPTGVGASIVPTSERSRDETMRDLVNRGLIPGQALERRSSEILRDLVNRGLIPSQTLDG
jgi:hypothetical protein